MELIFESRLAAIDGAQLERLVRQAWRANAETGVTGVMRLNGSRVEQVLEGDAAVILPLAARILADPRHGSIRVTAFGAIAARRHDEWRVEGMPLPASPPVSWEAPQDPQYESRVVSLRWASAMPAAAAAARRRA